MKVEMIFTFRFWNRLGVNRLCRDTEFMIGRNPGLYWRVCWGIITPIAMIIILLYTFVSFTPLTYRNHVYPDQYYGESSRSIFSICSLFVIRASLFSRFVQRSAGPFSRSASFSCRSGHSSRSSSRRATRGERGSLPHSDQRTTGDLLIPPLLNRTKNT